MTPAPIAADDLKKNAGNLDVIAGEVKTFGDGIYTEMQGRQGKYQNATEFSTYADGKISNIDGWLSQVDEQVAYWTKMCYNTKI